MTTVTLLSENCVNRLGLLAEHGLSWWIDTGDHRVLFDTGQGMVLFRNTATLGIDLASASAIVLSHGHYDHTSGLPAALEAAPHASLWMHPRATEPKFTGSGETSRRISTDFMEKRGFAASGRSVTACSDPREVVPGIWMTGEIPRTNDFEDTGGPFYLDAALTRPDPLLDDQAVFFRSGGGVVVVLGCSHAGVVNTLRRVGELTGGAPLVGVMGGAHLAAASEKRMNETLAFLRQRKPGFIAFNHCTGENAVRRFTNEFGPACGPMHVGDRKDFPPGD